MLKKVAIIGLIFLIGIIITAFEKTPGFQPEDESNADMSSTLSGSRGFKFAKDVIGFLVYGNSTKNTVTQIADKADINLPFYKSKGEVIGFLPYWLLSKADKNYSKFLTTLSYFSLSLDSDGKILRFSAPGETEPGYLTLKNGKVDEFLENAKNGGLKLSLVVFSSDDEKISAMIENPGESARNLVDDVFPIMADYKFSDLNLDVEQVKNASSEARLKYTEFVKNVSQNLKAKGNFTLSIDVVASSFVRETNLVSPKDVEPYVDQVIVMAYDFHHPGSFVTGPVAPGEGGGTVSEYDIQTTVKAGLSVIPKEKFILGIPLYGYEWESIRGFPRAAVIPGTGITISSRRAKELLDSCGGCSATFDEIDMENYIIYKDEETGNYRQAFYPDIGSTRYKIETTRKNALGGLALWALGYEDDTILTPLSSYRD